MKGFCEYPARALVDLDAITSNTAVMRDAARGSAVMAIVKADAYGHGLIPVAKAALAGGATWLGVAQACEALRLREAGIIEPRLFSWLHGPGMPFDRLIDADVDVSIAADWAIDAVAAAARQVGKVARVHVKVDTGLGRNGVMPAALPALAARLRDAEASGALTVVGVWTHLAYADEPGHPTILAQRDTFDAAVATLEAAGLSLEVRHIANSAAVLTAPEYHYELVRPGISLYGFSPIPTVKPPSYFGLRPAMTLEAEFATVKDAPAGTGVSYAHQYVTPTATRLGIVPLGYADGIDRHASGGAAGVGGPVYIGDLRSRSMGRLARVAGRVCMDQFVLDLGPGAAERAGDIVTLFGPSDGLRFGATVPNAEDWADAIGSISYEVVTRLGPRVPRVYLSAHEPVVTDTP